MIAVDDLLLRLLDSPPIVEKTGYCKPVHRLKHNAAILGRGHSTEEEFRFSMQKVLVPKVNPWLFQLKCLRRKVVSPRT